MATRQVIKTGTTVDDGTGDLLRDAFVKVNTNFENVWDKTSVNSNLDFTGDTVTGTGDLIISPASDIKFTKSAIFNSNKGNFDLTVHGDTSDNVLFIDASTNRVGILNNAPTVALDVTGDSAISGNLTVGGATTLNGNVTIGNAVSDIVTYVGRVGSTFEPYGNVTIGTTTNRWLNGYYQNLDVTGTISGTFSGSLDPSTTVTNNINSTTIIGDSITATTSATVGNLLVTGTMAVQGASVTIDSATMQILDRLTFEGATADDFETVIVATDPTADRTITLPDASGTVAFTSAIPTSILNLGITDGSAGQQLTTDGSGNFTFAASGAGGGIALTDLSVTTASAGTAALSYNNASGVFDFTPPDLSTYITSSSSETLTNKAGQISMFTNDSNYLTSVPAQTFASLTGKPTTVAGYGITDASSASATETLTNKTINTASNTITIVEADISDLGSYLTSVPAQTFASLTGKPTTLAGYGITDGYANSDVDTHLNQSGPTDGYVLSWTSGDYAWVANAGGGYGNSDVDTHLNTSGASAGQVLSWNGSDYAWAADATGGATSINTAGNTGTGSVTFASETLTVTGTTGQIDVDAAAWALSLSLDADLTGLSTINTHTIPGGTGTLALTTDYADGINVNDESSDTTCFPMFGTGATGALTVKTDQSAYTYNASTETLAVTNFSGDLSGKVVHTFVIAASGSTDYTFSDADNHWFPSTETDPVLYLRRGETYVLNVDALSGSHPFEIRVSNGGSAYGTGVTNNGATSGNITFKVPMSAPATLYYQCTAHAAMGNTINIV